MSSQIIWVGLLDCSVVTRDKLGTYIACQLLVRDESVTSSRQNLSGLSRWKPLTFCLVSTFQPFNRFPQLAYRSTQLDERKKAKHKKCSTFYSRGVSAGFSRKIPPTLYFQPISTDSIYIPIDSAR
jgi:hypothetical protein